MKRGSAILLLTAVLAVAALTLISPPTTIAAARDQAAVVPAATHGMDQQRQTIAEKPRDGTIVSGNTVFFGCATGAALGAAALAVPPMVAWAAAAGALPAVVAVTVTAGIGCTVGLFANVIITTVGWVFARIGQAWSAIF